MLRKSLPYLAATVITVPLLMVTGAAVGAATEHEDCGDPPAMAALAFGAPQVIDDVRAGGEPSVEGLPDGTLLYASHASTTLFHRDKMPDPDYATPYTGATYLWRSTDGGVNWQYVGTAGTEAGPHATVSGFSDPDFAVDTAGNVYTSGINLANVYVAKSEDSGATWTGHPFGTLITDREWLAADEEDVVYLNGNQLGVGRQLWKSTDGGLTFDLANPVDLPQSGPPSKIHVDQSDGRLYFPDGAGSVWVFPGARDDNFSRVEGEINEGMPSAHGSFNDMAIDHAGNVYVVSNTRNEILVSYSTDRGLSWTTTVIHDTGDDDTPDVAEELLWPWISAGADGRVGVSWYQADQPVADTETTSASYRVYAAQTITGHGWVDECEVAHEPIYEVAVATPEPLHTGTVCSSGTTCQAEPQAVDRRLGDYHTNAITSDGSLVIAYADTSFKPNGAISHPGFVRQDGGTDFVSNNPPPPSPPDDEEQGAVITVDPLPATSESDPLTEEPALPVDDEAALDDDVLHDLDPIEIDPPELPRDESPASLPIPEVSLATTPTADDEGQDSKAEPADEDLKSGELAAEEDSDSLYVAWPDYSTYAPIASGQQAPDSAPTWRDDSVSDDFYTLGSSGIGSEPLVEMLMWACIFTMFGLAVLVVVTIRTGRREARQRGL